MDQLRSYRSFVSYIDRSREYYAAQGYNKPYAWPHYDDVPFAPPQKTALRMPCRTGHNVRTAQARKPNGGHVVSPGDVCRTGRPAACRFVYR